ncbi:MULTISPECIES: phage baseplate assembly protein V [Mangrovibacter]|uniref:phage baseplate assembly protein V n=1 Tax=Mangrovibacter TaxID=451512 RepID=UPI0004DAE573|nr:phage baseplate assembly protein V [Mangrovibacter sp. MFB070]KEA51788.1 phage baseplate protein [Mangrovibacter sp. MFB070]
MGLNPENVGRTLNQIARRLRLLVDRAVVRLVTDSLGRQNLQVQSLADATNDDVERFQQYGLTTVPPAGSEAIVLAVGGRRESLVAIAVEDKRCRPKGLEAGDVCLYHQDGQSMIILKKGGIIDVRGKTVNYTADDLFEITTAQFKCVGPSEFTEDITVKSKSFLDHIHKDGDNEDTTKPL